MMDRLSKVNHYYRDSMDGSTCEISRQWYEEAKDRLATYEDLGTPEQLTAALSYQKRIVQCNDCRYYHYSEEAGGSVCCNNESDWVADFPPSDCSCQYCERRAESALRKE